MRGARGGSTLHDCAFPVSVDGRRESLKRYIQHRPVAGAVQAQSAHQGRLRRLGRFAAHLPFDVVGQSRNNARVNHGIRAVHGGRLRPTIPPSWALESKHGMLRNAPLSRLHTSIAPQQGCPLKGETSGKFLPPRIVRPPIHRRAPKCTSQGGLPSLGVYIGTLPGCNRRGLYPASGLHPTQNRREPALGRPITRGLPGGVLPIRKARRRGQAGLGNGARQ